MAAAADAKLPKASADDISDAHTIDNGSFGIIHKCKYKGQYCALKTMHSNLSMDSWSYKHFKKEINHIYKVCKKASQFVQLLAVYEIQGKTCGYIMEYCEQGNMRRFLTFLVEKLPKNNPRLPWLTLSLLDDVCTAMVVLQERLPDPVMHRDLAIDNILITADLKAKLSDFGLSKSMSSKITSSSIQVQSQSGIERRTPEQLQNPLSRPTLESDRYQFGICLVEALTCASLRRRIGGDESNFKEMVLRDGLPARLEQMVNEEGFDKCSPEHRGNGEAFEMLRNVMVETVKSMVSRDPSQRPKFSEVSDMWASCLQQETCINENRRVAMQAVENERQFDIDEVEVEAMQKQKQMPVNIGKVSGIVQVHKVGNRDVTIDESRVWSRQFPSNRKLLLNELRQLASNHQLQLHWKLLLEKLKCSDSEVAEAKRRIEEDGVEVEEALVKMMTKFGPSAKQFGDAVRKLPISNLQSILSELEKICDK